MTAQIFLKLFLTHILAVGIAFLAGCASTNIIALGRGQYLAVVDQSGGFPGEAGMIEGARDAAAQQCGGLDHVHVIDVNANANYSYAGNHGHAGVRFECVGVPNNAVSVSAHRTTRVIERDHLGRPIFRD